LVGPVGVVELFVLVQGVEPGLGSVAVGEKISMPAQDCSRAYQQSDLVKRLDRESVQQCREERSVAGGETRPSRA
jgi:hypothetical protein